jgi:hypothetical protein
MATGKLKLDEVLLVCDLVRGNVSRAAERLAVTRWALQKFLKRHPRAQDAFTQWRQRLVDEAESQLWDCVQERQPWAIALVLKTLGKFRGYIEAQHLTPAGQSHLPQRDDGEDDEPWIGRRGRHRGEDVDELAHDAWPDLEPAEPEWAAREAELIRCFHAERQTLLDRIRELEAAPAAWTADPPPPAAAADDAEVMAEIQRLTRIAEDLQRRVKGPS